MVCDDDMTGGQVLRAEGDWRRTTGWEGGGGGAEVEGGEAEAPVLLAL